MRYKTKDIGDEGVDVHVGITEAWLKAECPDLEVKPASEGITLNGRIERTGEDYLLRATLRGGIETSCSRCLELAHLDVDLSLTLSYVESDEVGPSEDDEEDEEGVVHFQGGVIDLSPQIRDELLLALPIGPICREDCAGICPTCGRNRNLTPCDCKKRPNGTSKFGALAKLKI
jgi:uncharacterized protein